LTEDENIREKAKITKRFDKQAQKDNFEEKAEKDMTSVAEKS